jgi:hypothetical protein
MTKAWGGRRRKEDLEMSKVFTFVAVICNKAYTVQTEVEFLDVIGTKVLRVFLFAIYIVTSTNGFYPPPPPREQK